MKLRSHLFASLILGLGLPSMSLNADDHGHVIIRDQEGNCIEDDEDDCENESSEESHDWSYDQHAHGIDDDDYEDPTHELDVDTSHPSSRELFQEQFR